MTWMYKTLRQALSLAVDLFYVDIQATGRHHIPAEGPIIFAANHPNSVMDTVILGSRTTRQISYMAKSGLFKNPAVAFVFNQCGVIPVFRNPKDKANNEDSFRRAFDVLDEGGAIGIFPEGQNSKEREVLEIKTGTARIALGAVARSGYKLPVKIVPVGLNFEDRDMFLSRVLVRFSEPIECLDYAELHQKDEREAVRQLTEKIQECIQDAATHIQGVRILDLVKDIDQIYGRHLLDTIEKERIEAERTMSITFDELRADELDLDDDAIVKELAGSGEQRSLRSWLLDEVRSTRKSQENLDERFWVKTRIAEAVRYFEKADPAMFNVMKVRIWTYKDHLRQVRLRHEFLDRPPETLSLRREGIKLTTYAILFAIPAVWGFVQNVLPYLMTKHFALLAPDEAMRAIWGFFVGIFIFGAWYSAFWAGLFFGGMDPILASIWVASLPVTGFFFLRYRARLSRYRSRILTRTLFQTETLLVKRLREERENILKEFDGLRQRFLTAEEAGLLEEPESI